MPEQQQDDVAVTRFFHRPAVDFESELRAAKAWRLRQHTEPLRGVPVALADLVPTQDTVSLARVRELLADPLAVALLDGQMYLFDGHHHAVAAMLRGDSCATAEFLHLDALLAR